MQGVLVKVSNKEEWQALVDKLKASGLTKSEFFRRNKISSGRFYDLAKRYGDGIPSTQGAKRGKRPAQSKSEFVEIAFENPSKIIDSNPRILRIKTSYGTVLEIPL
jgi:hypothetical protein